MHDVLYIYDKSREHRLVIFQRDDDSFGFELQYWSEDPLEQCWVPYGVRTASYTFSLDAAVREACGRAQSLGVKVEPTDVPTTGSGQ